MEKEIEIEEKTVKLIANNNEKNEEIEIHEENLIEFLEDNNEEFNLRDSLKQSGLWAAEKFSEVKVKKGKIKSTWETLWLYLRDENLLFFSSDDIKKPPKFLIILDNDCKITEQKKNSFSLEYSLPSTSKSKSSKAKTTSIMVDSDEDFKEWIEVISSACKSFKKPKTQYEEPKNLFPDDHLPLSIRVCSYNVNFGCCIRNTEDSMEKTIVRAISLSHADVILIQESTPDWEFYFQTRSSVHDTYHFQKYDHYQNKSGENRPPAGGIAILSKFPIKSSKLIESPCGWFPAQLSVVETIIGDIQILNLHLRPPLSNNAIPLPHIYFSSKNDRLKEVEWYSVHLDKSKPVIVCGDFNENEQSSSALYFTDRMKMKSALAQYDPSSVTWWWNLPTGKKITAHFDHIFYRGVGCIGAKVIQFGASDHYPIYADICKLDLDPDDPSCWVPQISKVNRVETDDVNELIPIEELEL